MKIKIKGKEMDTRYFTIAAVVIVVLIGIWFFSTQSTRAFEALSSGTIQVINKNGDTVTIPIKIGDTAEARRNGFKKVSEKVVQNSVLFIPYQSSTVVRQSMNEVKIPLDMAFFREDGTLIDIIQAQVGNQSYRPDDERYLYVLKAPRGYFRQRQIEPGEGVQLLSHTLTR